MLGEGHALLNQVASGICFQVLHIPVSDTKSSVWEEMKEDFRPYLCAFKIPTTTSLNPQVSWLVASFLSLMNVIKCPFRFHFFW